MTTDAELRAALARHPVALPDAEAVHAGIRRGVRRRRQRRRTATGIGVLAVVAVPVLGLRLLDGGDAPRPAQVASAPSTPTSEARLLEICSPAGLPAFTAGENAALEEFADAGYTPDDAERLAGLWKSPCWFGAKITGGESLAAGEELPVPPSEGPS